ncbi:hypothetical protein AB0M43_37445 [Longispora sp. NPDC051575]|uniref:pentapeptide repeat-containing protein n=1 Tax=Longispora sp. NPDC051575 TaxID=3154943 RepID=UPI00341C8AC7
MHDLASAPDPDRWIKQGHVDLIAALGIVLDVKAGLRDVLLTARHATFTEQVRQSLDIEAGLAAILPTPQVLQTQATPGPPVAASEQFPPSAPSSGPGSHVVQVLMTLDPSARLMARYEPAVVALTMYCARDVARIRTREFVRDLDDAIADGTARALARTYLHIIGPVRNLILALDKGIKADLEYPRALDRYHGRRYNLNEDLEYALRKALADDADIARDLGLESTSIHGLDRALSCDLERFDSLRSKLVFNLNGDEDLDSTGARSRSRPRARADALDRTFDLIGARARALADALDSALDLNRNLVRVLAHGHADTRALAHALEQDGDLDLDLALDRVSALDRALLDFSGADLSGANLERVRLRGVLWSDTTVWPQGWVDRIHRNSIETEPGTYKIQDGPPYRSTYDRNVVR